MHAQLAFRAELLAYGIKDKGHSGISGAELSLRNRVAGVRGSLIPKEQGIPGGAETEPISAVGDDLNVRRQVGVAPPVAELARAQAFHEDHGFPGRDRGSFAEDEGILQTADAVIKPP